MKLLVDMFACQTGSRFRGIGRYTHSLVREMIDLRGLNQMVMLANSLYGETFEDLRREYLGLLPQGYFLPYLHQAIDITKLDKDPNFEVSTTIVRHAYEMVSPDAILYPSVFEGWGERGVVPLPHNGFPSALCVAIVFDFIPYRFSERFLDPDPFYKESYLRRLESYTNFDLLLAISESTRQDAIQILNIAPEKIVNISAAANSMFKKKEFTPDQIEKLFHRLDIRKPYILYTGHAEYHKNMEKMLQAFLKLPQEIRKSHQVVLTHTGDEKLFRTKLRSMQFIDDEVVITGHISDEDLVMLYNLCKLFVFPSLYEGFGLPILEAMACGAPVIASNNSSIPEVMGRADAMFDASSEASITEALFRALTDDSFCKDLAAYGLERVKLFSWGKSAQTAWDSISEALTRKNAHQESHFLVGGKKPRIAYVSPLLSQKPGLADYSADLLPYLQKDLDIDLFVEPGIELSDPRLGSKFKLIPWTELLDRRDDYATVVYQLGNSEYYAPMMKFIKEFPGVVVLHDFFLGHVIYHMSANTHDDFENDDLLAWLEKEYGQRAMVDLIKNGVDKTLMTWPLNWQVLKYAQEIVAESACQNDLLQQYFGKGWTPRFNEINSPRSTVKDINHEYSNDYSAEAVAKLPEFPKATDLSNAMLNLCGDENDRQTLAVRASKEISEKHTSERIANDLINVIFHAIQTDERRLFEPLIDAAIENDIDDQGIQMTAAYTAANLNLRCQPRILIDVSNISNGDAGTGIQRLVKNVIIELFKRPDPSVRIELVSINGEELYSSLRFLERLFNLPMNSLGEEKPIDIQTGDYLYMLDSSWHLYDLFLPIFAKVRKNGGRIFTIVHDLIPIQFPETCDKPVLETFDHWLRTAIQESDVLIGVSKSTIEDVIKYIDQNNVAIEHKLDLAFVHNGADFSMLAQDDQIREQVRKEIVGHPEPSFLMIGTIEPRKGHLFALDAFDQLWQKGIDYRLYIIGKIGWNAKKIEEKIKNHPELGKRLFFIGNATDAELNLCYEHATALISASIAEGFGLPIIEAAFHKIPAIVSDIPVFHEVGGEGSLFFSLESPKHLTYAVQTMANLTPEERLAMAQKINILTWKESASMTLEVLQNKRIYKTLTPKIKTIKK